MKLPTFLTVALLAFGLGLSASTFANEPSIAYANDSVNLTQAQLYVHPVKKFAITVPRDAEIVEREDPVDVSIRSREGWVMHIQSGPVNHALNLEELAAKLESRYLGANRPWTSKLLGGTTEVAGLPAYQSLYEGSGSRTRVVIVRAGAYDMALLFIAPEGDFGVIEQVFYSMLAGFQPPTGDVAALPSPKDTANRVQPSLFRNDEMGVSIAYPGGWEPEQRAPHMVVFTRQMSIDQPPLSASLQNLQSPLNEGGLPAVNAILQEVMAQMAYSVSDIQHSATQPIEIRSSDQSYVEGRQLVSDFTHFDTPYRQWSVALPREGSAIVHMFTFVAPKEAFASVRPMAEQMVQSWTLTPVAR